MISIRSNKHILAMILSVVSSTVLADVIECHYTEPYLTFSYNTRTSTLVASGLDLETKTYQAEGIEIMGVNEFRIKWSDGGVVKMLNLSVDYKGGDQMSDQIYPYSAQYFSSPKVLKPLHGGCSSTHLKKIIPADLP